MKIYRETQGRCQVTMKTEMTEVLPQPKNARNVRGHQGLDKARAVLP